MRRESYDGIGLEIVLSHEKFTRQQMALEDEQDQDPDLLFLKRQTRTRSNGAVLCKFVMNLYFPIVRKQKANQHLHFIVARRICLAICSKLQ
jgi:hypothetical protein